MQLDSLCDDESPTRRRLSHHGSTRANQGSAAMPTVASIRRRWHSNHKPEHFQPSAPGLGVNTNWIGYPPRQMLARRNISHTCTEYRREPTLRKYHDTICIDVSGLFPRRCPIVSKHGAKRREIHGSLFYTVHHHRRWVIHHSDDRVIDPSLLVSRPGGC